MPTSPTPPQLHFIIPDGQNSSFVWESGSYSIQPFQMLDGNWAVPYAVLNIPGLPQEFKDSLMALNSVQELSCCDFRGCNHEA